MILNYLYRQPSGLHGTFGIFAMPDFNWCCHSLEQRWVNNTPWVSCIPANADGYIVKWTESPRLKRYTYQIMCVPGRSGNRIHPFNWFNESQGCTGFGQKVGVINRKKQLIDSGSAVKEFEILMNKNPFRLVVR